MGVYVFLGILASPVSAWSITNVSPLSITSADQEVTIEATGSGTSDSYYFQVAFTKVGETRYFGYTRNGSGDWVQYKSTPDLSALFKAVPTNKIWSGQILGKIDTSDSDYKGSGNYSLVLYKYVNTPSSSEKISSDITLNINLPSTPSQQPSSAPSPGPSPSPTPTSPSKSFNWTISGQAVAGEKFKITLTLANFEANKDYYLKIRAGPSDQELNKFQTTNGNSFLGDTDTWSKFPIVKTNSSGQWSGEISGRFVSGAAGGSHKIRIRTREVESGLNFDSEIKDIKVLAGAIGSAPVDDADSGGKTSAVISKDSSGKVLSATQSSSPSGNLEINLGVRTDNERAEPERSDRSLLLGRNFGGSNSDILWLAVTLAGIIAIASGFGLKYWYDKKNPIS